MTDRYKGVVVTFDRDIREDDAQATLAAIRQIKGVLSVEPSVTAFDDHMAREVVRRELSEKLMAVLWPKDGGNRGV